jgi:hypothetical protein
MTAVRIAHADPWPGRKPDGRMSISHVLVVLTDAEAGPGRRALFVRLGNQDGGFWRLLARPEDRDDERQEASVEETTGQVLDAAGITVTAVGVTDLGPGVIAARIDIAAPGGARQVTTRLADGLAIAVITGAPLGVDDAVMDRLAEPVTGPDLLSPFRDRQRLPPAPRPHRRFEPHNMALADDLHGWQLDGTFRRQVAGFHDQDYVCTAEDGRAILSAAVPEPAGFAFLSQPIFADDYRGRTVTFHGELRSTDVADRAGLVLRVSEGRPAPGWSADRDPRHDPANHFAPVTGTSDWTRHEITVHIPPDATFITFGVFLNGRGQVEFRGPGLER